MELIIMAALLTIAGAAGVLWGIREGRRQEREYMNRMRRIEPTGRTPGLPTNMDVEPSTPRRSRWRAGSFRSGPPHPM